MQHDVPCCLLCKAWRQLGAFLHLASVIFVSGDSHLVQGGKQEGATQTVSENGFFYIHLLPGKKEAWCKQVGLAYSAEISQILGPSEVV